jgi:hypothetical protein
MDTATLVGCDMVATNVNSWLVDVLNQLKVDNVVDLTTPKCKALNKETLADTLILALIHVNDQNKLLFEAGKMKDENEALKSKLIDSQGKVIDLQAELLSSRSEQLDTLQTTVKTSVEDTVKAEFLSYSAVAQKNNACSLKQESLTSVVKQVVEDTDRSMRLMMFGLSEEEDEKLCERVSSVFEAIGEKPRFEACRLGKSGDQDKLRPVKVTLTSATTVYQILKNARNLKTSDSYQSVFISPDRSPDQRAKHKELVQQLKTLSNSEKHKRHFIRDGAVHSVDK